MRASAARAEWQVDAAELSGSSERVVGIDPGAHGALALLEVGTWRLLDVADMPIRDRGKTTTINALDGAGLRRLYDAWRPSFAVLENAQPMPDLHGSPDACPACKRARGAMPPKQAFTFGGMVDGVRVAFEVLGTSVLLVQPAVWKRAAGIVRQGGWTRSDVKAESLRVARTLWPDAPLELAKHEARAEAMLIARYGLSSQMSFF